MNEEMVNNVTSTEENNTAIEQPVIQDSRDKVMAQLEAYKRCFMALQTELAEIEKQYGAESSIVNDPLKELAGEVSGFKSEMAELRKMLENLRNASAASQQVPPHQQYYYQAPQPPMVTATHLPYLQTPSFAPLMPTMPTFNR